ncbi:MAG: insulinase family protein [Pseudomonadota bacterium]|nr:insulinase family protein [Pseudomonadota bacterium]
MPIVSFRAVLVSSSLSALLFALLFAAPVLAASTTPATPATPAASVAVTPAKLDAVLPAGPQVKVGKLANGLTYYIQKNTKPARKLELRLVVKAGSILEDEDQQGLAHFTEHMAFNGSTNFKKHELVSWLQSIGVKFGADLNAYTSFDETVYILPIPTDRKEDIDKGFLVLQDWAGGLAMHDADIDKERDIVLEELRLGKGAGDRMNKVLMPKIFNGSRYAQRLPIGKEEIIRHFKPDALRRFYKDWYRPDLMAVMAVGDVEPQDIERLINKHFGALRNPAHERVREYAPIPPRQDTEALVVLDREAGGNGVLIRYPVTPVRETGTLRDYRNQVVDLLFSSMLNARLQELAQLPNPPFMGAASTLGKLTPRYKAYSASATVGAAGPEPALAAMVMENERARRFGFSNAELDRAKKNLLRVYERAWNEREKTDSGVYVAEYTRNFLQGESIPGIAAEYQYVTELVPGMTLAEMNAYARRTIPADSGKLVIYTGSDKPDAPAPTGAQLLASVDAAKKAAILPRAEKAIGSKLLAEPPVAGTIVAESVDPALGLTRLTLSNGVKVILKPTDFRNDQVLMSASRYGGQALFEDKDVFNARYANSIVATMGLGAYSPVEVQKVLAGKAATVSVGLSGYNDVVSGASGATDIETMFQMLWLKFNGVRRDDDLYTSFIGKQVEAARNRLTEPSELFGDTIAATLYANSPRAPRAVRPEDFKQVSLDRSIAIYRERFSSARGLTFILVGSFDVKTIKPLIATYLASLPTPDVSIAFRDVGVRPVLGVVKKEVRRGTEAKSTVSLTFTGKAEYSEAEQVRMQALIEVMNIRIVDILREKLTLIYGGGMSGTLARIPYPHYAIGVSLPTGPDNVDKVIAAVFAEIDRIKTIGPEQADLEKVKRNWLQGYQKSMRENGYWLGRLQATLTDGTDPASILTFEQEIAKLTADDVKAAASRYFNTGNYVQVVLNPEKAVADTAVDGKAGGAD